MIIKKNVYLNNRILLDSSKLYEYDSLTNSIVLPDGQNYKIYYENSTIIDTLELEEKWELTY